MANTKLVLPSNENVLAHVRHPVGNAALRGMTTPTPWPDDQFTARRIQDGDVVEAKESSDVAPAAPAAPADPADASPKKPR